MSRIGNKPVAIPKGVEAKVSDETIAVKGPKGSLQVTRTPGIEVVTEDGTLVFKRSAHDPKTRAAHGLMRALTNNAIVGVSAGWERKLEINGVGYRAEVAGQKLTLQLGYSHPIEYNLPTGVAAKVEKNVVTLTGIDKQVLGQCAAEIRGFRPPEPYKGKGVKYVEETIKRKVGKAAG